MKWEKLGQIFHTAEYALADECTLFARSPQALVFDDFIRIFYCAQRQSENGKYLSCPHYADFNKTFDRVLRLSRGPVIELGGLGTFDEHGIFPLHVMRHEGRIWAYTCGWSRRTSVSIDMAIGLAHSDDEGNHFVKHGCGGPVMAATPNEPFLIGDPFVQHVNGVLHMWYIFGDRWERPTSTAAGERFYHIAHATSTDGITWERNGIAVIEHISATECQAHPTVFFADGRHHMYFCYRDAYDFRTNRQKAYRLGYAFSRDLIHWQRDDAQAGIDVTEGAWDSDMLCYPYAFACDGNNFLLYNGNSFGKYGFGIARLLQT